MRQQVAKVVFTQKPDSIYDDLPEEHYHFPKTYLNQARQAIGDWVLYYRPRRGSPSTGRQPASSYFAVARLIDIFADPGNPDLYYARVADYLEFDDSVSFRRDEGSYEVTLLKADGSVNKGAFGRAVRTISDDAFDSIIRAGFASGPRDWETIDDYLESDAYERPLIDSITKRYFRDRRFRLAVCDAYQNTCAITGLALLNGGGRPEVQAAHIQPVEHRGPDSVRNGLALSGTVHWMFDRGLITVDEDFRVVTSRSLKETMHHGLIVSGRQILLPYAASERPSNRFLEYHRDHIFHE